MQVLDLPRPKQLIEASSVYMCSLLEKRDASRQTERDILVKRRCFHVLQHHNTTQQNTRHTQSCRFWILPDKHSQFKYIIRTLEKPDASRQVSIIWENRRQEAMPPYPLQHRA